MQEVEVFGPQPGTMRAKVHENGGPVGSDDFQRKRVAGFGQALPGLTDLTREFFGIHSGGKSGNKSRGLEPRRGLNHRVERVDSRHDQQLHCLTFLFSHRNNTREQFSLVICEQLTFRQIVFPCAKGDVANGHHHNIVSP